MEILKTKEKKMETLKTLKPKMVSMQYDEKKHSAAGILKINGKEYTYSATTRYVSNDTYKFVVDVKDLFGNIEKLADLGIETDFSEFEAEFNKLEANAKLAAKDLQKKMRAEEYDKHIFVTKIVKEIQGAKLSVTRENYMKMDYCNDICISYEEVYKESKISIDIFRKKLYSSISRYSTGIRYEIKSGYNRGEKMWCKSPEKIADKFKDVLEAAREKIDMKIKSSESKSNLFERVKKEIGSDVTQSKICHRDFRGYFREEDAFIKNGIQFKVCNSTEGKMKYKITSIDIQMPAEQLNKIANTLTKE